MPAADPLTFLTVASTFELPFARALVASVREQHPGTRIVVVRSDDAAPDTPFPDAEVMGAPELGLPVVSRQVAELSPELTGLRALLPALTRELDGDGGHVVVLAPDTILLGPIDDLLGAQAPVTLVGRPTTSPPDDGLHPDRKDLDALGPVDPGVIVLRRGDDARRIAGAWRARLEGSPWTLPEGGTMMLFLEDLIAAGDAAVLDAPAAVFAWWAAWQAALGRDADGGFTTDGRPIALLRLHGFDVALPTRLHPLFNRLRVSRDPVFRALLDEAAARLRAAGATGGAPAALRLPDGKPIPSAMAGLLAEALTTGALEEPPQDDDGWQRFYALLNTPADWGQERGMTRYLDALWHSRDDLREVYPDVRGADLDGYLGWVWVYGADLVPDELLPPRPAHIPADARGGRGRPEPDEDATDPLWGVNVAGFFRSELGLGEAARQLITGLDAARVPALPVQGTFIPPCRQGAEFTFATPDEAPYPLNILCLNGDAIPGFAAEAGEDFFTDRHTIALWWWEVGDLPASWQEAFRWVDEVWVATDHIRELIAPSCPVPVTKVTLPVAEPPVAPVTRTDVGLPEDPFVFLYVYDYHSTEARKNPTGLVRAFKEAFPPGSGAHLVLKCINADTMFAHHDRVLLEVDGHPDISFVDRYLSVGEKNALLALADCYVSPHRSEGFGLTLAESMLLGTPVISTNYGGVLEFLTPENAFLVDYELRPVGDHAEPYPPDAVWADPDLDHLARTMRHVFEHPDEAAQRAATAARDVREEHGPTAAGRSMEAPLQARYDKLMRLGAHATRMRRVAPLDLRDPAEELRAALRPARGGSARGRAAQIRQRLARAITARRDRVDARLLEEIAVLDERVRLLSLELERHRMASHAEVLAQFRRISADVDRLTHQPVAGEAPGIPANPAPRDPS